MRTFIAASLILMASVASATTVDKLSFQPFSSASSISCGVFGTRDVLAKDSGVGTRIQGAAFDPAYSRTLTLGTKTMRNYSTNIGGTYRAAVAMTCHITGTNTLTAVKVGHNGSMTNFMVLDSHTFVIGY